MLIQRVNADPPQIPQVTKLHEILNTKAFVPLWLIRLPTKAFVNLGAFVPLWLIRPP